MSSEFPTISLRGRENTKDVKLEKEDVTVRTEMQGGYVYTRPRHTRRPRRTFMTGFGSISEAHRAELEAFYDAKRGGSDSFTYTPPYLGVEVIVRFKGPIKFDYVGYGTNYMWNVTGLALEEV